MIDIKIRYQAVAFMPGMETNQSNISQMMGIFADKGLIPTTFQEVSMDIPTPAASQEMSLNFPVPQLRFSLNSPNNEWNIHFGIDKVGITKNATDIKGNNLGTIEQFSIDISSFFAKIFRVSQKANRLALSSNVILKEMTEEVLNSIYEKLFNPIQLYSDNKPTEWNSRAISRIRKQVSSAEEIINFISEINRINGQINLNQKFISLDRIAINLDINTIPNNSKYRFGESEVADFYKTVSMWHNDLLKEIFEKVK
jgi:hypothetical protein